MRGSIMHRWAGQHHTFWGTMASLLLAAAFWPASIVRANDDGPSPSLQPGAIEIGVSGSLTTVEGVTTGAVVVRGGYFFEVFGGLGGAEGKSGFMHVSSLDALDLEVVVSWNYRVAESGNYPFVSLGGGLRHESLGSFELTRYPVGFGVGLRSVIGRGAGVRVEYQFRRILNDPVSDLSEHQVLLGISLFLRNG